MKRRSMRRGLYAIADTGYLDDTVLVRAAEQALRGGACTLQYRDKASSATARVRQASALRALCAKHAVCFLINDDVALAHAVGADGVHLGRDDVSLDMARQALGTSAVIGVSCYNELARAERAVANGADYVAFGSFFPSRTKPQAVRADISLLQQARARFSVPRVAIGGITPENGGTLIAAGADALAVIAGVFDQTNIETAARRYASLFEPLNES